MAGHRTCGMRTDFQPAALRWEMGDAVGLRYFRQTALRKKLVGDVPVEQRDGPINK
jgi:hypothetical protein